MSEFSPEIMALGDAIYSLTPMQAGQLVEYLEEVHHIKAAGGLIQGPNPEPEKKEEKVVEQTEFTVIITEFDASKKIGIVKEARVITGLGLKESMSLLGALPATVKEGVSKAEAEKIKGVLEGAGAKVIVK